MVVPVDCIIDFLKLLQMTIERDILMLFFKLLLYSVLILNVAESDDDHNAENKVSHLSSLVIMHLPIEFRNKFTWNFYYKELRLFGRTKQLQISYDPTYWLDGFVLNCRSAEASR